MAEARPHFVFLSQKMKFKLIKFVDEQIWRLSLPLSVQAESLAVVYLVEETDRRN